MTNLTLKPIGKIKNKNGEFCIVLEKEYISGLTNIDDFKYLNILWWFDKSNDEKSRSNLIEESPYVNSPEELGVFATRSPERPNPIALTCSYVTYIDRENGIIGLAFIDAFDNSPVLDIKPYSPAFDRIEKPILPSWCQEWPNSLEESADFDWSKVFNF
ncbi:MAG: SAM-dependent methyltransferase [Coprobacillaceae bacterium]